MTTKTWSRLSRNYARLLEEDTDYDLIIQVGEEQNTRSFRAHSVILRAQCKYFQVALSKEWARTDGDKMVFSKPNTSPAVFEIILRYVYTGITSFDETDCDLLLDLLSAANEMLLPELVEDIEDYLVANEPSWMQENLYRVLVIAFEYESCKKLQTYCLETICGDPSLLFESEHFLSLDSSILVALLQRDDLRLEEVDVWEYLLRWGRGQVNRLMDEVSKWSAEEFTELEDVLRPCIPLVRFFHIPPGEFRQKVWPYKAVLPQDLYDDIMWCYAAPQIKVQSIISPPRLKPIDSNIIKMKHVAIISSWVDRKDGPHYNLGEIPYQFRLLLRGSRDGFSNRVFHSRCDSSVRTVVIVRIQDTGEVIGGYNPLNWSYTSSGRTEDSFIFSFGDGETQSAPILSRVHLNHYAIAIGRFEDRGPNFGGADLWMQDNFNLPSSQCWCRQYAYEYKIREKTGNFVVDDYEVFQIVEK
ncbi:2467_t:CDS:2 [Paraglomus occultum]|uniref:2467_t:CDS:1 n=1 Tax=Paraglomus occultum TaxID=144539 RepID=A0A9N9BYB1_9GLOM|nr:2467_t:CDS:2 [Paraglomus occultum]